MKDYMSIEDLIPEQMRNVPPKVRETFKDDHFSCDCGGRVFPFNMTTGVCIGCGTVQELADCEYEEAQENEA